MKQFSSEMMMNILQHKKSLVLLALMLMPSLAVAEELNQANTAWVLTSTALVLFMTLPGLSLFYAGLVRSKNVLSVLMQCFAITCLRHLEINNHPSLLVFLSVISTVAIVT